MEATWKFLQEMKKRKLDAKKFPCPCKECRNMRHYDIQTIYEHLIIKEIDPTYNVWYHHGEVCEDDVEKEVDDALMLEATILYKSTYIGEEDKNDSFTLKKDKNISHNIQEANTPLYTRCTKYTKISKLWHCINLRHMVDHMLVSQAFWNFCMTCFELIMYVIAQ